MPYAWNAISSSFDIVNVGPPGASDVLHIDPLTDGKIVVGDGADLIRVTDIDVDASGNITNIESIAVNDIISTQQNLNLEVGVDVQPYDADLDEFSQLTAVAGDVIFGNSTPEWDALPAGSEGQVLKIVSGLPAWAADSTGGDVVGPASAVDGNLASFDGITGKLIADSGIALADVLVSSDIGSSVQAFDDELADIAALVPTAGDLLVANGTPEWTLLSPGFGLLGTTGGIPSYVTEIESNFTFGGSAPSAFRNVETHNTDLSSTSHAGFAGRVDGAAAGDVIFKAIVDSVQSWAWGLDNSDSDSWVLSLGEVLGTGNVIRAEVNGDLDFTQSGDFNIDNAVVLNGIQGSFSGSQSKELQASVQTTDATETSIDTQTVSEGEQIIIEGRINAAQSDHSAGIWGTFSAGARRPSAGNITLIGSPQVNFQEDFGASPSFDIDIDTGTQTIRIRVTGVAATTINWVATYKFQKTLTDA